VISHDRYFLDRTVEKVIELKNGSFEIYPGSYSDFALRKALKILTA
jgi:ATPase subunit of ABC transporter with duplicated ATPase domains